MSKLLTALADHWRAIGLEPAGGASAKEIEAFEHDHGVRLPADVREYFATLNGTREGTSDDEFVTFWSLARVRSVVEELGHQETVLPEGREYFCFADYSLWCNAYAVRLFPDGRDASEVVAVYSGVDLIPSAPSFSAFLRACVSPDRLPVLHPPWEKGGKQYGVRLPNERRG